MQTQILEGRTSLRRAGWLLSLAVAAALPGCASFKGIGSEQHITATSATQDARSLPAEHGHWPAADWAKQFGDHQLGELIAEALRNSPTLDQARARIAAAGAYVETARAATEVKVNADASITRQQYTSNALVPPPYAGSFRTENKAVVSASYELDVWGKNSENLQASLSKLRISEAEQEKVKLTLSTAIARSYNELARLYALRELAGDDIAQRRQMRSLNAQRVGLGLDTAIEQRNVERGLASGQASLTATSSRCPTICRPTWWRAAPTSSWRGGASTPAPTTSRWPRPTSTRTSTSARHSASMPSASGASSTRPAAPSAPVPPCTCRSSTAARCAPSSRNAMPISTTPSPAITRPWWARCPK